MATPSTPQCFALRSQRLGCLPVVNFFMDRLGLTEHLDRFLPHDDPRLRLAPAAVARLVVANIASGHLPIYALGQWAAGYDPAVLGLGERTRHASRRARRAAPGCWTTLWVSTGGGARRHSP